MWDVAARVHVQMKDRGLTMDLSYPNAPSPPDRASTVFYPVTVGFYKSNDELLLVTLRAACVNNNSTSKTKCSKTYKESFKTVSLVLFCLQTTNTRSTPWTLCHLRHRGGGGYSLRNWCWLVSINCAATSATTIDKAMFGILERQKNGFRWLGSSGDLRCRHKHR